MDLSARQRRQRSDRKGQRGSNARYGVLHLQSVVCLKRRYPNVLLSSTTGPPGITPKTPAATSAIPVYQHRSCSEDKAWRAGEIYRFSYRSSGRPLLTARSPSPTAAVPGRPRGSSWPPGRGGRRFPPRGWCWRASSGVRAAGAPEGARVAREARTWRGKRGR